MRTVSESACQLRPEQDGAIIKALAEYLILVEVERTFAEQLEKNEAVKVYAKLPSWFKVSSPLGTYNPDWAVLIQIDGQERLYLVVETKGQLVHRRPPRSGGRQDRLR